MDHAEARALLDAAAIEPDGIERLEAGDTPEAAALAGHLAGCPSCATELTRLRGTAAIVREAVHGLPAEAPPPELRERTLAYVRDYGRPRASVAAGVDAAHSAPAAAVGPAPVASVAPAEAAPVAATPPTQSGADVPTVRAAATRPRIGRAALLLGLAAALVVGIGLGGLLTTLRGQEQLDRQAATITALTKVNDWTMRVASAPDATSVALTSPSGEAASGSILYSPVTTELIAVMNGVAPPPQGREYRCWVRTPDGNEVLGKMYFGGDVGYWGGRSPAVAGLPVGAVFGVSLVDVASGATIGDPVLTGTL